MDKQLLLYQINSEYIDYLKQFEKHIWDNKDNEKARPYVGVIINILECKYYIPLSSPKEKHRKMKNRLDFMKIMYKDELKAVLNINNLIPVHDSDVYLIDIDREDEDYRDLLKIEISEIRKNSKTIINNAKTVYNKITKYKSENEVLARRCYDFKLLEEKMREFQQLKETSELVAVTIED